MRALQAWGSRYIFVHNLLCQVTCRSFVSDYIVYFFVRTINPVDAIYGIIKEMAGDANSVKYVCVLSMYVCKYFMI